jgi:ParB family transcriptional regulator, chromosome partitioning protein
MTVKVDRGAKVNEAVLEALKRPATPPAASPAPPVPRPGAQTWVGRVAHEHNTGLKDRIAALEHERDHGFVVLKLDPKQIRSSEFANRHARSLDGSDPELDALKASIRAQGQLEPIRVRVAAAGSDAEYEIVYGHRRHAAALALDAETDGGWPVLALLDAAAADIRDHVLKMYQENAARKDLSAFETGTMFANWLEQQVFANQTELGEAVNLSQGTVAKYLAVAGLPEPILAAFGSPLAVSLRWGDQLAAALKERRAAVLETAARLRKAEPTPAPEEALRALLAAGSPSKKRAGTVRTETVKLRGRTLYKIAPRGNGMQISFGSKLDPKIAKAAQEEVKDALTRFLAKRLKESDE